MRIKYRSDYPQAKRMHSVALRAPLACPMTGDGEHARYALHDRYGRLRSTAREVLVESRYYDWLAAQDRAQDYVPATAALYNRMYGSAK